MQERTKRWKKKKSTTSRPVKFPDKRHFKYPHNSIQNSPIFNTIALINKHEFIKIKYSGRKRLKKVICPTVQHLYNAA